MSVLSRLVALPLQELILWILLFGFSLGIAAYNAVLFIYTRALINLRFSAALLSHIIATFLYLLQSSGSVSTWPYPGAIVFFDVLSLLLFTDFAKHFANLSADFQRHHPTLVWLMNITMVVCSVLLIAILLLPYFDALSSIRDILLISTCLTVSITSPCWFKTMQHQWVFSVTLIGFTLLQVYFYVSLILHGPNSGFSYGPLNLLCSTLLFLSFSILVAKQLNQDKQQREIAQQTALEHLQKYQLLYDNAIESLFSSQLDGLLISYNPAFAKLFNIDPFNHNNKRLVQECFNDPSCDWQKIRDSLCRQGGILVREIKGVRDSGEIFWYMLSAYLNHEHGQDIIEGSLVDITERKRNELELQYLAQHDSLTHLVNRREFERHLQHALTARAEERVLHALLYVDLDQFKLINDTCGHPAGDECLRQIAALLRQHIGQNDILARLGGDEFGILLKLETELMTQTCAERIQQALDAHHFHWQQRFFKTSASIGLVYLHPQLTSVAQAMSFADAACYAAKASGRNRVVISDLNCGIARHRHSQMEMIATLNQAIKNNHLVLFRQPIVPLSVDTQDLQHYEVLVRLYTEKDLLNPKAFLPAAQRFDLLPQIDRWVFKTACQWLAAHIDHQQVQTLNINLSPQTLSEPAFLEFIKAILIENAISPMNFCFEITEYSAINNFADVLHHIEQLREIGIRFALDDFGSGFASFDYVKRLPVDFIKIDGQFIRTINQDETNRTMVQAVCDIAHTMGKQVIGESVEDQETAETLRTFGIDYGQGFYFGEPEPLSYTTLKVSA